MPNSLKRITTYSIIFFFNLMTFQVFAIDSKKSESTNCDDSKKIYKICNDQQVTYQKLRAEAIKQKKLVVIVFGADWCPWCKSMHMIFQNDNFKKDIAPSMIPYEIGVYQYNSKQPVDSGVSILNQYLTLNKLNLKDYKSVPLIAVIKPEINIQKDKVMFIKTGDLEKNTATSKGHDSEKVLKAILNAKEALSS